MKNLKIKNIYLIALFLISVSCENQLDIDPNNEITIRSVEDFELMFNSIGSFGGANALSRQIAMQDTFYWDQETYDFFAGVVSASGYETNDRAYLWEDVLFRDGISPRAWEAVYKFIFQSNYCLDLIDDAEVYPGNEWMRNQVKGEAFAFRAYNFFVLVNNYAKHYSPSTAASDPGIPMPLVNKDEIVPRSTVKEVYEQIISDAEQSVMLLTNDLPDNFLLRFAAGAASKAGMYGFLSRLYLYMATDSSAESIAYLEKSVEAANAALAIYGHLEDLNGGALGSSDSSTEILWFKQDQYKGKGLTFDLSNPDISPHIDSELEDLIDPINDLRMRDEVHRYQTSLGGFPTFRGNDNFVMMGIHTPEVYLNKAEALARLGNLTGAADVVNHLRSYRFLATFDYEMDTTGKSQAEVITDVINEKRIEFGMCETRWWDQKRLILLGEYDREITRFGSGTTVITLSPSVDEIKYVLQFPIYIRNFNSDLTNR